MSYGSLHSQGPKNGTGIFSWGDRTDMHKVGSNVEEGSQQYFEYGELTNGIAPDSHSST